MCHLLAPPLGNEIKREILKVVAKDSESIKH
jgi:hypothetical protein